MARNFYTVTVTLTHNFSMIEADSEDEALKLAKGMYHEELPEGCDVEKAEVTETELDGPANHERYQVACQVYYDATDKHGKESPEAQAAWKAIPSLRTY